MGLNKMASAKVQKVLYNIGTEYGDFASICSKDHGSLTRDIANTPYHVKIWLNPPKMPSRSFNA